MNAVVNDTSKKLAELIRKVLPPNTSENNREYLCQL